MKEFKTKKAKCLILLICCFYFSICVEAQQLISSGLQTESTVSAIGNNKWRVRLSARDKWFDTKIYVERNFKINFSVAGFVNWGPPPGDETTPFRVGPNGTRPPYDSDKHRFPMPDAGCGSLIMKIGGKVSFIGEDASITTNASGNIQLMVNDDYLADNSGSFTVDITTEPNQNQNNTDILVFSSYKDGNQEVYKLNLATGNATVLTQNRSDDGYPRCSPDRKKIAFATNRDGYWEIYSMNADGNGQQNLTNNRGGNGYMDWSPDGQKLVFASTRNGQKNNEIYTINADGTGLKRLTNHLAEDVHPVWSPDGKKIAFASEKDGNRQIYVMNADGSGLTRLMTNRWYDDYPAWSPDGSQIAFSSDRDSRVSDRLDIYTANANGSGIKRITSHPSDDRHPAWSPDGGLLAFASNRDGDRDIYTVRTNGAELQKVFSSTGNDEHPQWCGNPERSDVTSKLFVIKDGGKYGYIDETGKVVINPQFDDTFGFAENGLGGVRIGNKYSFIDKTGKIVLQPQYEIVQPWFSEGLTAVRSFDANRKAKFGFIDSIGKLVIPLQSFDDASQFSEGFAAVGIGGRYGYIDKTGRLVIKPQFLRAFDFYDGMAKVLINDHQNDSINDDEEGFIDKTGKLVIPPRPKIRYGDHFFKGVVSYWSDEPGITVMDDSKITVKQPESGFLDKRGEVITEKVSICDHHIFGVCNNKDDPTPIYEGMKCGYADKTEKIIIEPLFERCLYFSEGLAPVMINKKWGFVDKNGKIIIKPQFNGERWFKDGLVIYDNVALNKEGVVVWTASKPTSDNPLPE